MIQAFTQSCFTSDENLFYWYPQVNVIHCLQQQHQQLPHSWDRCAGTQGCACQEIHRQKRDLSCLCSIHLWDSLPFLSILALHSPTKFLLLPLCYLHSHVSLFCLLFSAYKSPIHLRHLHKHCFNTSFIHCPDSCIFSISPSKLPLSFHFFSSSASCQDACFHQ